MRSLTDSTGARSAAEVRPLRESPQRWWLMVLLATAMIFCYAQRNALSVAAPFMIRELGLSPGIMGVLLAAFFWSYSFMQIPAGWVVDRFGVRRAYAWGFGFWSLITALTGVAKGLGSLIAIRIGVGVGQSVAFPASARAVANWFQERERGTVASTYLTGVRLGQALVTWAGALLIAVYGWQLFFIFVGLLPLLWIYPWMRFLSGREVRHSKPQSPGAGSTRPLSFAESLALFKHRSVVGIFLGFFAYDYAWFLYSSWLAGYLVLERKFTTVEMGIYGSVPFLIMSGVILVAGMLSDWFIRRGHSEILVRKLFIVVGLAVACLIVPAGLVEDRTVSLALIAGSLSGLGIASPNTWTLTQAVCPRSVVGTVSGIQNFGGNLGGSIAPALTGYLYGASKTFVPAFWVTAGVLLIGILVYWFLINEKFEEAINDQGD